MIELANRNITNKSIMKRRTLILVLTLAASLGAISGCGRSEGDLNNGDEARKLVMATSADYPPYEFYETAKGGDEPVGFDIDIAKYITQELGYELEIKDMDFSGVVPALQAKRADFGMAGMTPTEEREKSVDFSSLYYDAKNIIVAKKDSGITKFEDLVGKKIGVQLGTTQEAAVKKRIEESGEDFTIDSRNKIGEIIQEIKIGRIDATILDKTVAQAYLRTNSDLESHVLEDEVGDTGSAIAFPKGSELIDDFETVLQQMRDNGELDRLITKWFEDYYEQQEGQDE